MKIIINYHEYDHNVIFKCVVRTIVILMVVTRIRWCLLCLEIYSLWLTCLLRKLAAKTKRRKPTKAYASCRNHNSNVMVVYTIMKNKQCIDSCECLRFFAFLGSSQRWYVSKSSCNENEKWMKLKEMLFWIVTRREKEI